MYKRSYLRRKVVKLLPVNEGASAVPGPGIGRIKVGGRTVASAGLVESICAPAPAGVGIREEADIAGDEVGEVGEVRCGKQEQEPW